METMHAAGRRNLPPVPRATTEPATAAAKEPDGSDADTPTERFVVDLTTGEQRTASPAEIDGPSDEPTAGAPTDAVRPVSDGAAPHGPATDLPATDSAEPDHAQQFVAILRAAAADFADAAGAESAVVREAVPPARHRRARCRIVLRYADESLVDVTFLGSAGRPGTPSRHGFDRQIRRWLAAGQRREDAWLVADPEAPDGLAVDLSAWVAAA